MKSASQISIVLGALLCLILASPSTNAEEPSTILDRFTGTWTATGNSFGDDIESEMVWTKTLDGQFYRIAYQINMQNSFRGIGHYKSTGDKKTTGYWVDNSGDLHPLSVTFEDDAIITIWGTAGKKQGRTEYRLISQDRATVTDWLLTGAGWRQFNHGKFERTSG